MKKGAVTLMVVILVVVAGLYVLVSWQSRLLLGIQRSRSVSDSLAAVYTAESEVYDWAARFLGGYPEMFDPPLTMEDRVVKSETLPDGTKLTVTGWSEGEKEVLLVNAERIFATTDIELTRVSTTVEESIVRDTDIVFSLDCSASMGDPACAGCESTRMEKLKEALNAFIDTLAQKEGNEKVRLGVVVFSLKSDWLYTGYDGSGNPSGGSRAVKPEGDISLAGIRAAINAGLKDGGGVSGSNAGGRTVTASPACKKVLTETNIGSGLTFMHEYFAANQSGRKQVEVLITDGVPNQRTPYNSCPVSVFCPWDGGYCPGGSKRSALGESWTCPVGTTSACEPYARDFLRCALAASDQRWTPEKLSGVDSQVAGWSAVESVVAFEGTPTPTRRPTATPTPTRNPLTPTPTRRPTATPRPPTPTRNLLTPTPTRRPTSTPRPTRTPTPTPVTGQKFGIRDPKVDVYVVSVLDNLPAAVASIFNQYATKHYNSATANQLTEMLQSIFQDILESLQVIDIRRVVPSPVR